MCNIQCTTRMKTHAVNFDLVDMNRIVRFYANATSDNGNVGTTGTAATIDSTYWLLQGMMETSSRSREWFGGLLFVGSADMP